ncbi:MAG: hypothetical protein ACK5L0_01010 [Candidatus Fimivivens sp.]
MTTAKSSFNAARILPVYKNLVRHHRGSAIFYGVLSFIFLGLQYVFTYLEHVNYVFQDDINPPFQLIGPANVYNGVSVVLFTTMSMVVAIIMATNLFDYMQNKRSVDVYHALPLTRSELYFATSAAGLTLIWVPLILNFLFVSVCAVLVGGQNLGMIFLELLCWMVITFVIFALTAFSAVNVGTTFDTAIFSLGLNVALPAVYLTILAIANVFLYGFNGEHSYQIAYRLSPMSLMYGRQALSQSNLTVLRDNNMAVALWFIVGLVLFFMGLCIYKKRHSEQAESVGNLGPLQIFMRSVGALVGGALLGTLFWSIWLGDEADKIEFLISVAFGALIIYFIGDVILTRTVRSIPRALPAALATTLGICLLVGGILFGGFGHVKRVPSVDSVKSVRLVYYRDEPSLNEDDGSTVLIGDPKAVELMTQVHQAQVKGHLGDKNSDERGYSDTPTLTFTYTLKNGRTLSRRYHDLYPDTLVAMTALEEQPELIRQSHAAFKATPEMLSSVTVSNVLGDNSKTLALTLPQKEQLLEAVRADLLSWPLVKEVQEATRALGHLEMEYQYMDENIAIFEDATGTHHNKEYAVALSEVLVTESFTNTRRLIEQFGAVEQLNNDFSKVEKAYVGILGDYFRSGNSIWIQTRQDGSQAIQDMLSNDYRSNDNLQYFVEIDSAQLMAIRDDLTNVYAVGSGPYVVVAIANTQEGEERISGHYYLPFEKLSDQMQYKVYQAALNRYNEEYLYNRGYDYLD